MLVEDLKTITTGLGWIFNYGPSHWQNLGDYPDDSDQAFASRKKYFLLYWKDQTNTFDEWGTKSDQVTYDGEFVFVVRSKIQDEDYNTKYQDHIKGLELELEKIFGQFNICGGYQIKRWKIIEIHNSFDTNMDGLKVKFTITHG